MNFISIDDQKITCLDCFDVLPALADESVNMIFCDLPYGITKNRWDTPLNLTSLWQNLLRVGKQNAAYIFTATQPFATTLINSQPKLFRYDLIWERNRPGCFVHAKRMPLRSHETLLVFYRSAPVYIPQKTDGKEYKRAHSRSHSNGTNFRPGKLALPDTTYIGRFPRSVIRFASAENRVHPTQKPVALLEWIIRTYSNPGDTILDPTCGSGTTLVACRNNDRRGIGIEKDKSYFDTICARLRGEVK